MIEKYIFTASRKKLWRQQLRNNSTRSEILLWACIKDKKLGTKFRRQHSIGRYIVDFYAPSIKLVIEIDGSVHDTAKEYDSDRDALMNSLGIKVVRLKNEEIIKDLKKSVFKIMEIAKKRALTVSPGLPGDNPAVGRDRGSL